MMATSLLALAFVACGVTQDTPVSTTVMQASEQAPAAGTGKASSAPSTPVGVTVGAPVEASTLRSQRKAAGLYLQGVKQLQHDQPEAAWKLLKQAAELDPGNDTYSRAAELARQSMVTQLIHESSRLAATATGGTPDPEAARLLERAKAIDPANPLVLEHLGPPSEAITGREPVGATAAQGQEEPEVAGVIELQPNEGKHSFHLRSNARQVIQEVFRAYGLEASVHESVQSRPTRFEIDDASFAEAMRVLAMVTGTFYEPLDPHRAVVAKNTRELRTQFQRLAQETIYLPGLTDKELTDASELARNAFDVQQAVVQPTQRTLTLRGPGKNLVAFNHMLGPLEAGHNEVELDVKVFELAQNSSRETGITAFQQTGVYNLASEAAAILAQNQSAVQQIIAAGLVPNADGLTNQLKILFLLLEAGQLTGPPFNQGLLLFGNGITASLLAVSPVELALSLNSSDSRMLDDIHMSLQDDEAGTFKTGERYPIKQSSFSSVALPAISGLSSQLAGAQAQEIPQVQYEDLGLTLKATPKVMRSNDVALTLDLKIEALGGTALNDIPILDNRSLSGVVTIKAGETAVMASELSRSESRALNGNPGIGDIPGLEDIGDTSRTKNLSRLLVLVTPRVIRETQLVARSPRILLDKGATGQ